MKHYFFPDELANSAYDIDYKLLYEKGYRAVIYDIDNTLVMHGAPANDKAVRLFEELREIGFDTILISNNKEKRVKSFADAVRSKYIFKANKPSKRGYIEGMNKMNSNKENTIFVGDQLFTDVFGARRVGIYSFLVKPIDKHEEIQIVLKRYLERVVLFFYKRYSNKR